MQNAVYAAPSTAVAVVRGDIELVACTTCGFCFNAAFDEKLVRYDASYDNAIPDSEAFDGHLDARASAVPAAIPAQATVVDVGCGKGAFLKHLVERHAGVAAIGIDATYEGSLVVGERLRFERLFFGGRAETLSADAVVCRHVIAHIADPVGFLREIRVGLERAPATCVFFEAPAFEWIVENGAVWDVFYEHCNYFTAPVLELIFSLAGFRVTRIVRVFGGQYHWIEALVAEECVTERSHGVDTLPLLERFAATEPVARERLYERLTAGRRSGAVALWGAAAKGTTLANLVDPKGTLLDALIDLNPAKQGDT